MKRILTILFVVALLSSLALSASAEGLLIAPNPNANTQKSEEQALIESFSKGIIPITPDMTYEDFLKCMLVVDESEDRFFTAKFETLLAVIEYYYYGELTADEIFSLFAQSVDSVDINNMDATYTSLFSVLDKFSYYLTGDEAKSFFEPTASKGAGIMMLWREADGEQPEGIYIEEVANGSTAEEVGIMVGDRLVEFNGHDLRGLGFEALNHFVSLVEEDSETISITYVRDSESDEERNVVVERRENLFDEYSVKLYPEKKLVYLDINSFMYSETAQEIGVALDNAWLSGCRNIIIDLQDNTGGDVYVAQQILSKLTNERKLLFSMGRAGDYMAVPMYSTGFGYDFDKISVLINSQTASSAEIFAYTLKTNEGAKLYGEKSFGKGVAQNVLSFVDGAVCGVTTFVAYNAQGKTYNEVGIKPDVTVYGTVEKNALPDQTPSFTALNYSKASEGANNEVVRGLEIRLEAIGYLSGAKVDGVWDDATSRALGVFQSANGLEATGELNDKTYFLLVEYVKAYESSYYFIYTPFDYAYRFMPYAK